MPKHIGPLFSFLFCCLWICTKISYGMSPDEIMDDKLVAKALEDIQSAKTLDEISTLLRLHPAIGINIVINCLECKNPSLYDSLITPNNIGDDSDEESDSDEKSKNTDDLEDEFTQPLDEELPCDKELSVKKSKKTTSKPNLKRIVHTTQKTSRSIKTAPEKITPLFNVDSLSDEFLSNDVTTDTTTSISSDSNHSCFE